MKKFVLLSVILFIVNISFAQFSTMFNDTLRPFGNGSYANRTICADDSFYYVGGVYYNGAIPVNQYFITKLDNHGNVKNKNTYFDTTVHLHADPYNSMVNYNDKIYVCLTTENTSQYEIKSKVLAINKHTLDTIWTRTYPHPDTSSILTNADKFSDLTAIKSTPDSAFILAGNYMAAGSLRSYLMKIDSLGDVLWTKTYSTISSLYDVEIAPNGGYMLIRKYWGAYAVLTDSVGNILWQKKINSFTVNATVSDMNYSGNNSFVGIVKYISNNNTSDPDFGLNVFKINIQTQQIEWNKTYQLYKSLQCITLHQAMGVETLSDGSNIVSGTLTKFGGDRLGFILKLNSNGDSLWTKTYHFGNPNYDDCQLNDLIVTDDGGFMGVGFLWSQSAGVNDAAWMFKTDANGVVGWDTPTPLSSSEIKIWPNPAHNYTTLSLSKPLNQESKLIIYNALGQRVKSIGLQKNISQIEISLLGFQKGIYYFEILTNNKIIGTGKIIKE